MELEKEHKERKRMGAARVSSPEFSCLFLRGD